MSKLCLRCGATLEESGAFCPACGTPVDGIGPDDHRKAVSAAIEDDGRLRFRLGLAVTTVAMILIGIVAVLAKHSSSSATKPAVAATESTIEPKPSPAPSREVPTPEQQGAASTAAMPLARTEDHELHEDGRVYSVAVVAGTPEIPVGAKLFVQGRVVTFDCASGMRSRPFVIIEDEKQPRKTLLCGMTEDEGADVFSLYHVGEVVAVSGEYMATTTLAGYPTMPLFRDCHVAGPQNNVVRPTMPANSEPVKAEGSQDMGTPPSASTTTQPSRLQFDAGVRVMIRVDSMTRQPDGSFVFRGSLLLPITLADALTLDQHTQLAGSGTVNGGHIKVQVTGFTVRGENYRLQQGDSSASKRPGTGRAIELDPGKVLEMWFASASGYEKAG
jgi:hypothetical protein